MNRIKHSLYLYLLLLLPLLMNCGGKGSEQKILKVAVTSIPSLELYTTAANDVTDAQSVIFDGLFYISKDEFMPKPMLAESWSNPDPLTWIFNLRKGVMFHDDNALFEKGKAREMTAEDVVFSINFLIETSTSWTLGPVTSVKALDDYTVEIKTATPQPFLVNDPNRLTRVCVIPREAIEKMGREEFAKKPVGTGPFKFSNFAPDSGLFLVKHEKYWLPVQIDAVEFVVIPDPTAQTMALQTGEVDVIKFIFNHEMLATLEKDPNIEILRGRGGSYRGLGFNVTAEPYNILEVRRGISMLMDIDMARSIVADISERAYGQCPPWVPFGYDPSLANLWEYNPAKGKALLERNGFKDLTGNGFYEYNGKPFKIEISTLDGSQVRVLTILATQLREQGIEANVVVKDTAVWAEELLAVKNTTLFFDYSFAGTTGMRSLFHGDMIGMANTHGYNNPKVNALLDTALTKTDFDELSKYWKDAQRIIFSDVAGIPLYFEYSYAAVRKGVGDFVPPWGGLQLVSTENSITLER